MQSLRYRPLRVFVITSQQVSLRCTQRFQKHLKVKVCTRKKTKNKKLNITWPKIVFIHVINPNTQPNILVIFTLALNMIIWWQMRQWNLLISPFSFKNDTLKKWHFGLITSKKGFKNKLKTVLRAERKDWLMELKWEKKEFMTTDDIFPPKKVFIKLSLHTSADS